MKAVGYFSPGKIDRGDALVDLDLPAPVPGPRDLLVRVMAISVNPADTKIRATSLPGEDCAKVLGWDAAGIVEAIGPEVSLFEIGDEVFYAGDVTRQGANAELHAVDERIVGHKPRSLGWAEAAAMPLTSLTAWELLFDRLGAAYGEGRGQGTLLVINGAGGVGSVLIQIARKLTGLTVIATASRPETRIWVTEMGAHHVIDHRQPLAAELARIGFPEVDYVASLTGSDHYASQFPEIIAPQGRLALIDDPKQFDIAPLKRKSIAVVWEWMFTRAAYQTSDMISQHEILEEISALLDRGVLRSTLTQQDSPISAASLKRAHAMVESGRSIGKLVLADF